MNFGILDGFANLKINWLDPLRGRGDQMGFILSTGCTRGYSKVGPLIRGQLSKLDVENKSMTT
jgi:hypothetical protein